MSTEQEYYVDSGRFDAYVRSVNRRQLIINISVMALIFTCTSAATWQTDSKSAIFSSVLIIVILTGSYLWGQYRWTRTLFKFKNASYKITSSGIELNSPEIETRFFRFEEIALIANTAKGTVVLKGSVWAKWNYYRPKSGTSLDDADKIFIPKVTEDYDQLIESIRNASSRNF